MDRRSLLRFSLLLLPQRISLPGILSLAAATSSKNASAIPLTTAIATAQTAISLIKSFSGGSGDGTLVAYLQNIHELQKLSLELLDTVVLQIGKLAQQIDSLRTELPIVLEQSRLRTYLDDVVSAQTQFRILRISYGTAPIQQQKKLDKDFLAVEQQIVQARGRVDSYYSFDAALAVPICLSIEIASKYQNGKSSIIPETLRRYLNWVDGILDINMIGSLARTLKDDADAFNVLANGDRFKKQASVGCLKPKVIVKYWPQPEVNQMRFTYTKTLEPREILVNLERRANTLSGAQEIFANGRTVARNAALINCEERQLDARFGIAIEEHGKMVASDEEIEGDLSLSSDPKLQAFADDLQKSHQAELDSLNRKALRIALLSDAFSATQAVRNSVIQTLRLLGEL